MLMLMHFLIFQLTRCIPGFAYYIYLKLFRMFVYDGKQIDLQIAGELAILQQMYS